MIEYESLGQVNAPFFSELLEAFDKSLRSGWYVLGNNVSDFESEFATYCGVSHCVGTANGLDALILALRALDLPAGSEIIVPSNTYVATILAIIHAGLIPILCEPNISTYNIDPNLIEPLISSKSRGILVVHLYGKPCDMDAIQRICNIHKLFLLEDCAQAHGAEYKGRKVGSFGIINGFSFYPTKNLGALGDAGCITTSEEKLSIKIKTLRNYGSKTKYVNEVVGYNSRLDEVQAGFLRIKLKKLDDLNSHKRKLAAIYFEELNKNFIKPSIDNTTFDVYHIFNIRHEKRNGLKEYLLSHGIKTEIHYPIAPHRQEALKDLFDGQSYPISEEIHNTTLSLPISSCHTEGDILEVVRVLNKF